jgi:hypothetical protein
MGSGLQATWGFGKETTPGTAVAPSRWLEFLGEAFSYSREAIMGEGLRGGGTYGRRANRRVVVATGVEGSVNGELPTRGMGLLLQQMLGTNTPVITQQGTTTAYLHTYAAGDLDGKSLTVQKKVPFAEGAGSSVHTYRGCKVTSWTIACGNGEIATFSCDFDGIDETTATAYTAPSYPADTGLFTFKDGTIWVGGTVATSGGVSTRTGGTKAAAVTAMSITGSNDLKTDRRFFGNQGTKAEQTEAGYRGVSGSFETEFVDLSFYDLYRNDTKTVAELIFTSPLLAGVGFPCEFRVLLPAIYLSGETPQVGGPDVVTATAAFDAFQDGTAPLVQVQVQTPDSTI